jgi:putative NADPH-quinone reductase
VAKIAIIIGHARSGTYCDALGEAYRRGALDGGHAATLMQTAALAFDPILRKAYVEVQPREAELEAANAAIRAADHLVIIFPLYLGDMPAILKGFLERVLQPDLVEAAKGKKFVKLLKGKSARIIVTMGMPALIYRWYFGAHAVAILKKNILQFMGVRPVRSTMIGSVEGMSEAKRKDWLARIEKLGHDCR